jgi:hypothetical protein
MNWQLAPKRWKATPPRTQCGARMCPAGRNVAVETLLSFTGVYVQLAQRSVCPWLGGIGVSIRARV